MAIGTYAASDATLIKLRDVGIIDSAEVEFPREIAEYLATDVSGVECREYIANTNTVANSGKLTVALMSGVAANLGIILASALTAVTAAAATEQTFPTMAVGDVVAVNDLPDTTSGIVITDSNATPATLVAGTDWEYVAKGGGMVRILNIAAFTQPFKANYTKKAATRISPMSDTDDLFRIVLAGSNEKNSCGGEREIFYKARISEAQTMKLHDPAATRDPQPIQVVFTLDRDPARAYQFGLFDVAT
jgi:hypothetical protein